MKDEIIKIEKDFWNASSAANAEKIDDFLADDAVMIGSFGEVNKEETLEMARAQKPFEFWQIEDEPKFLEIDENSAIIYYNVRAKRTGAKEFKALISTIYRKKAGEWKIVFHHQTHL